MPRDYLLYLEDIRKAIEKIENYTLHLTYDEFCLDALRIDAVLLNLEVIGEAAKKLPEEIKEKSNEIEWRKISSLRGIIVHDYFDVSLEIIWDIIQNKIPELHKVINRLLQE